LTKNKNNFEYKAKQKIKNNADNESKNKKQDLFDEIDE
jgi:hypothetical protein